MVHLGTEGHQVTLVIKETKGPSVKVLMDPMGIKDLKDPQVCPEQVKMAGMVLWANLDYQVIREDPVLLGFKELTVSVIHLPAWELLLQVEENPKSHKAAFAKKWRKGTEYLSD
uniref:Uncharacterized protein n=1 Tax=Sphaerodactylus townsendi TaxID=933632 RepID=A0ACB8F7X3_9SAUR